MLLQEESTQEEIRQNNQVAGFKVEKFDYRLLKLFFVSILWRASLSTHEFYSRISAGPFEDLAKKLIWDCTPGEPEEFSCVLAKITDNNIDKTILDPHPERWYGINYYRFYLYGYVFYMKVDKRPTPDFFKPFNIKNEAPLIIVGRDISNAKEYPVLLNVVKNSQG